MASPPDRSAGGTRNPNGPTSSSELLTTAPGAQAGPAPHRPGWVSRQSGSGGAPQTPANDPIPHLPSPDPVKNTKDLGSSPFVGKS